jgi:hypothetical protein
MVCNKRNTTGTTSGTETDYPFRNIQVHPSVCRVRVAQSFVSCIVMCKSVFVILSFFFWPLSLLL